jgi:type I polyketide synthase AVES
MGRDLLRDEVFAAAIEACDHVPQRRLQWSLREVLANGAEQVESTDNIQPLLTAVQIGLASMLKAAGVEPTLVAGLSMGELAAAHAVGVLSLSSAMDVACGEAIAIGQEHRPGQMAVIFAPRRDVEPLIIDRPSVWLTGDLHAQITVVSGEETAVDALLAVCASRGTSVRRQIVPHAFHCPEMDPLKQCFFAAMPTLAPRPASVPFYSSVTGDIIDGATMTADYWWKMMTQRTEFGSAVRAIAATGVRTFVEVGPQPILAPIVADVVGGDVLPIMTLDDSLATVRARIDDLAA